MEDESVTKIIAALITLLTSTYVKLSLQPKSGPRPHFMRTMRAHKEFNLHTTILNIISQIKGITYQS